MCSNSEEIDKFVENEARVTSMADPVLSSAEKKAADDVRAIKHAAHTYHM